MKNTTHPIEPEELMAYLDGELPAEQAKQTAAHLRECGECSQIVAGLRDVSTKLRSWEAERLESSLPEAIADALVLRKKTLPRTNLLSDLLNDWRRRPVLAWGGALATILILVGSTVWYISNNASVELGDVRQMKEPSREQRLEWNVAQSNGGRSPAEQTRSSSVAHSASADKAMVSGLLESAGNQPEARNGRDFDQATRTPVSSGPMIVRTADLQLTTKEFDKARAAVESILKKHRGYVGDLKVADTIGSGHTLTSVLRVPADQLDTTLAELKTLGRVTSESQSGQDVTSQYVDLQARLANSRNTEKRLTDLLSRRTGKLSDVLEVEQEVDRVRGEIEQMEAERKTMANQVTFATVNLTIAEEYKAQLEAVPPATTTRLANAAVAGYKSLVDGLLDLTLWLLTSGPTLLFWAAILFFPARFAWKAARRKLAH